MSIPVPKAGLVIRYSFLWSHEKAKGADEAAKDRPCAIIVAAKNSENGDIRVVVAPITHEVPHDPSASLEIPPRVCSALGLDKQRQWLRIEELNSFMWPGFDLRPIPGTKGRYEYGMLPRELFEALKQAILIRNNTERTKTLNRD